MHKKRWSLEENIIKFRQNNNQKVQTHISQIWKKHNQLLERIK